MTSPLIDHVWFDGDTLMVEVVLRKTLSLPATVLGWRLMHASQTERHEWRLIGNGEGVHWPLLDEDLSAKGLIALGEEVVND